MMHNYTPSKKKSSLDVELGPLKIKQTKTGPGAKSSAYLCSTFAVKFLLFLGVAGFLILAYVVTIFGSSTTPTHKTRKQNVCRYQYVEISFVNKEVASEITTSHQIEKSSQKKLISMGNILEQFLLREAKEKTTAREYRTFLNEEFDRFFNESLKNPDEKLLTEWNEFRETIVSKIDGLLLAIEEEAEDAKGTLIDLNNMLSRDSFYPSRDRVQRRKRGESVKGSRTKREKMVHEKLGPEFGRKGRKGRFGFEPSKSDITREEVPLEDLLKRSGKSSVGDSVKHFFRRFDAIDTLRISDATLTELNEITKEDSSNRRLVKGQAEKIRDLLLKDDTLQGIDLDELLHQGSDYSVVRGAKEISGVALVQSHKDDIQKLKTLWTEKELDDGEVFHKLQELASLQDIPFEWFVGDHARRNDLVGTLGDTVLRIRSEMEKDEKYKVDKGVVKKIAKMIRSFERDNVVHTRPFSWWTAVSESERTEKDEILKSLQKIAERSSPALQNEMDRWEARKDRKGGPNSRKGKRRKRKSRGGFYS